MAGGFSVSIGSDTRLFEQGVKTGVIAPVEDAQDALQDLANTSTSKLDGDLRDSERALDKLGKAGKEAGDDLEQGLRGAQKETGRTEAEYRELAEKIRAETAKIKASNREVEDSTKESFRTVKEEALSNASETFSSFDGSAQSFADGLQGIFGGVVTDLGPVGAAIGAAGALAVGAISSMMGNAEENTEEFKERVKAASDDLVQTFLGDQEAGSRLDASFRDWVTNADRYGISLTDLQKDLKGTSLSFRSVASVIAGQSNPALRDARAEVQKHIDALRKQAAMVDTTAGADNSAAKAAGRKADTLEKQVLPAINQNIIANDAAKATEEALAKAQGKTVAQYRSWIAAQNEAQAAAQALADTLSNELASAAESTSDAIDNTVGNPTRYILGLEARTKAVQQYQTNVQAIGKQLPDDLFNFVREQGPGFSEEIATYLAASPAQQRRIQAAWKIDAQVSGDTSALDKKTAEKGKEKKPGPTSQVKGDTKDLDKKVADKGREKKAGPTSKIQADDSAVDRAIASLRKKRFNGPTAVFQVDRSSVDSTISSLRRTTVNVSVKAVP